MTGMQNNAHYKQSASGVRLIASQYHQRLWVIRGEHWCQLLHVLSYIPSPCCRLLNS